MTNVIKVKFLRNGQPSGRAYTYYTPEGVAVGDTVDLDSGNGVVRGIVTQVDVSVEEIAVFGDKAKAILGKAAMTRTRRRFKNDTFETKPQKFQRD